MVATSRGSVPRPRGLRHLLWPSGGSSSVQWCSPDTTCSFECPAGGGSYACAAGSTCNVACDGGQCGTGCGAGATCNLECDGGSCAQACASDATCNTECDGGNCSLIATAVAELVGFVTLWRGEPPG